MNKVEYIFKANGLIHVIQYKPSQNKKIGFGMVVQTYHFSPEQIEQANLNFDKHNCMDCPLSNMNRGGCYTHKGHQRMGLTAMLKRLSKLQINEYVEDNWKAVFDFIKTQRLDLVRFGAYGEAIKLPETILRDLRQFNYVSYTHQWRKGEHQYFMASTHSIKQTKQAAEMGYRSFMTMSKKGLERLNAEDRKWIERNLIGCPAAKESKYNKTCIECGLCNGNSRKGKGVFILTH